MPGLELNLNTNLRQQQELQITPAQLQKLEILQATSQELEQRVSQALMQNPMLEQVSQPLMVGEDQALRESAIRTPSAEDIRAARDWDGDAQEYRAEVAAQAAETPPEQAPSYDADGEEIPEADVEEPEYRELRCVADEERYPVARNPEAEERRQYFFDSLTAEEGFYTKLLQQISGLRISPSMRKLCAKLVGELDTDGYLRRTDEELAAEYDVPVQRIHQAVQALQKLDPPGIAAHDLRECLLLQLAAQNLVHSLEWDIVDSHLEDLAKNRIPEIANAIDADIDDTQEAILRIRQLNPAPGHEVAFEFARHIYPEVFVEFDREGNLQVRMAQDTVPILRLNPSYLEILGIPADAEELPDLAGDDDDPPEVDDVTGASVSNAERKEVRKFLMPKYKEARQLMEAIDERQKTIERVTLALVDMQRGFFLTGEEGALTPLTLAKVAERLDLSESTVSRAISNKHIGTPWGVKSFKSFFPSGLRTAGGGEVSSLKVRQRLRELVAAEDRMHPLSDQALSEQLKKEGYQVERRTVVKYRELDHIPPSNRRKDRR